MPEVLQYKLPMTKNGWLVSVPVARRVRALSKHHLYMYIVRSISRLASCKWNHKDLNSNNLSI